MYLLKKMKKILFVLIFTLWVSYSGRAQSTSPAFSNPIENQGHEDRIKNNISELFNDFRTDVNANDFSEMIGKLNSLGFRKYNIQDITNSQGASQFCLKHGEILITMEKLNRRQIRFKIQHCQTDVVDIDFNQFDLEF